MIFADPYLPLRTPTLLLSILFVSNAGSQGTEFRANPMEGREGFTGYKPLNSKYVLQNVSNIGMYGIKKKDD